MFNSVVCHVPENELHTRKSGKTLSYNITDEDYDYFGVAPDLDRLKNYDTWDEYAIENLCEQKAAWDILSSLNNLGQLLKKLDREELQEHINVSSCAPCLKLVEDVSVLSDKDRAIWNTLPTALKPGYLTVTEPKETARFGWEYDRESNCFRSVLDSGSLKRGCYSLDEGELRANSCITATALLQWMSTVEENTIRDINKTAELMGKVFPATDGWTVSFIPRYSNNLFHRVMDDNNVSYKATTKITVIGTNAEIEQLDSFLQERNLPTDFKKRVVAESVIEEAAAQEQLGNLFSGAVVQDKKPYGIFMLPAWLSITGCYPREAFSWSQMKHWVRLPVSAAVDLSAQYLKVLKSVKCYVAAPSQSGGYLVATSAGFFYVDDVQKPSIVQYRTLEQLHQMEGFSDYSKFSVEKELGKASDVQSYYLHEEPQYLCQLRAYYLSKHPLSDYGEITEFLNGTSLTCSKLLELIWTYNMPLTFMPAAAFKNTELSPNRINEDIEEKNITCYLQSVMHKMITSKQAVFFKDGKFVNGCEETYSAYMISIKDESKDLFCFVEDISELKKGGFNEKKHQSKTIETENSHRWWMHDRVTFAIPRPC